MSSVICLCALALIYKFCHVTLFVCTYETKFITYLFKQDSEVQTRFLISHLNNFLLTSTFRPPSVAFMQDEDNQENYLLWNMKSCFNMLFFQF